jgi:predicted nucleic acid-binding protein
MMDLVVDANILIAALIKQSTTAELMLEDSIHLYAPEFLLDEFSKYETEILAKTHRTEEDFYSFLEIMKRRINFIPQDEINSLLEKAEEISPDPNDVVYFAAAFKIGGQIWSNDKRMRDQSKVEIISTSDLLHRLNWNTEQDVQGGGNNPPENSSG